MKNSKTVNIHLPDECPFNWSRLSEHHYRDGQVKEAVFESIKPIASNHLD